MSGAPPVIALFVPPLDERKMRRARALTSGIVILDLEDAVPTDRKQAARAAVVEAVAARQCPGEGPALWVRVNASASIDFGSDLSAIDWQAVDGAVLPKAEDPAAVAALRSAGAREVVPMIESIAGLRCMRALRDASPGVSRFAIGTLDLALDLGLICVDADDSEVIWHVRRELVLESRSLGLAPPLDGVFTRLGDPDALRAVCHRARNAGFGGKLLIHPEQIPIAQASFGVDPAIVRDASALLEASGSVDSPSPLRFRDGLVDSPVVKRARAILSAAHGRSEVSE